MRINEVEIRNFYSFKEAKFRFDNLQGIVLIHGINLDTGGSNGSGKSALIESVVWGIFGKTIRKSTEEALVNSEVGKDCCVRIRVNDDYVIERAKRPTSLRFYKGEEELTQANAAQTQKLLEETFGTSYKVFLASTVFGQQNDIQFIDATPDDKRLIMRNFLNLDYLFDLRESVKYLKSEYSQERKRCDAAIEENDKAWKKLESKIESIKKDAEAIKGSTYADALDWSLDDIMRIEKENAEIEFSVAHDRRKVESSVNTIHKLEKELTKPKATKCKTCGAPVTAKDNSESIKREITQLKRQNQKIQQQINSQLESIQTLPISSMQYQKVAQHQRAQSEIQSLYELIDEHQQRIDELNVEKQTYNTQYEMMRFWEKAFSESGLVKYIIQNILGYFNQRVSFYLSYLSNGKFTVEFDDQLSEVIKHHNTPVKYISLSGGEKRKISLAVLLGLQDLLKISQTDDSSIMFFDEVAENLDEDGINGLHQLLLQLKQDRTIFVVTHNRILSDLLADMPEIYVTKKSGVSTIAV